MSTEGSDTQAMVCHTHPEAAADGVCAECHALLCWGCLGYEPDADEFVCAACAGHRQARERRRRTWRFLRLPFFYVLLAVVGAIAAYVAGVGNDAPWRLRLQDRSRPWHRQQLPAAWLGQAARCWQRADWLFERKQVTAGREYALTAQRAVREAADLWRDTPVGNDLALASALLLGRAGQADAARTAFAALAPQFSDGVGKAQLLYCRGLEAQWNDDLVAARADWREALTGLGNIREDEEAAVGGVIAQLAGSVMPASGEDAAKQWVRGVCRVSTDPRELAGRIRLAAHKAKIELRDPLPVTPDRSGARGKPPPAVAPATPSPGIKIERFE